jgi:hypothetical protein
MTTLFFLILFGGIFVYVKLDMIRKDNLRRGLHIDWALARQNAVARPAPVARPTIRPPRHRRPPAPVAPLAPVAPPIAAAVVAEALAALCQLGHSQREAQRLIDGVSHGAYTAASLIAAVYQRSNP